MKRILITPNVANPYDQRMVKGLAQAFTALGHYACAVERPLDSLELRELCQNFSISVVIQVNRTRDLEIPLPKDVRHVAWYQDVFPETQINFAEKFIPGDMLYTLGSKEMLGLQVDVPCFSSSLYTGVTDEMLNFPRQNITQDLDMSLCGGLPNPVVVTRNMRNDLVWYMDSMLARLPIIGRSYPFWLLRKALFGNRISMDYVPYATVQAIVMVVNSFYHPLRGELNIQQLAAAMKDQIAPIVGGGTRSTKPRKDGCLASLLKPYAAAVRGRRDWKARIVRFLANEISYGDSSGISAEDKVISYFSQSYPRIMDRELLVSLAKEVSPSLELWGPGLGSHDFAHPFFKGVIEDQDALLRMYCRSKINLANNTHGLGMHSRTLECMAVGGFIFMHTSPQDTGVGGMHTCFEPGVHYGTFTPESFHDEAKRWLTDDKKRLQVGEASRSLIQSDHRWTHRAQQILDDLER